MATRRLAPSRTAPATTLLTDILGYIYSGLTNIANIVFAMTLPAARTRRWVIQTARIATYLGGALLWGNPYNNVFNFILKALDQWLGVQVQLETLSPYAYDIINFIAGLVNPLTIQTYIIIWGAFAIAHMVANKYLDDIYELNDVAIARRFIDKAAFADEYETLHIQNAGLLDEEIDSPIVRIGGPGYVQVNLENAALFENKDGGYRIVAPTRNLPNEHVVLEGFERLRSIIDLRTHTEKFKVWARTRDGIRIAVENLNILYYINRNHQQPTLPVPYPFAPQAFQQLVYQQPKLNPEQVLTSVTGIESSGWTIPLENTISDAIRREMQYFISTHTLGQFLAAIAAPERRHNDSMEQAIRNDAARIEPIEGKSPVDRSVRRSGRRFALKARFPRRPRGFYLISFRDRRKHRIRIRRHPTMYFKSQRWQFREPLFVPRPRITDLFAQFQQERPNAALNPLVLEWIDVGTWHTPAELISERHIQAWQTAVENHALGNPQALNRLQSEARIDEMLALVQQVPILPFYQYEISGEKRELVMYQVLLDYLSKLDEALDMYSKTNQPVPSSVEQAYTNLSVILHDHAPAHWLGK